MKNKPLSSYAKKLLDPRWQKKRLEIFQRDNFECRFCGKNKLTLHCHHLRYERGKEPWECRDEWLITLCVECHESEYIREDYETDIINLLRVAPVSADGLRSVFEFFKHYLLESKRNPHTTLGAMIHMAEQGRDIVKEYEDHIDSFDKAFEEYERQQNAKKEGGEA